MRDHPDYKYRPRRKPKSVVKKENKYGSFNLTSSPMSVSTEISRGLLGPPLVPPGINHSLMGHHADELKIPRFFPPFAYPLYPIQHKMGEDFDGGKLAADLALQAAFYGSRGGFYTGNGWPGLATPNCLQVI